mmetsp:Transcript_12226/g.17392  ORF Transcript_12226/g.17392 Transcript_12226/m.17392 type:complete len:218 (+) Transcript_12226:480-1133(+)
MPASSGGGGGRTSPSPCLLCTTLDPTGKNHVESMRPLLSAIDEISFLAGAVLNRRTFSLAFALSPRFDLFFKVLGCPFIPETVGLSLLAAVVLNRLVFPSGTTLSLRADLLSEALGCLGRVGASLGLSRFPGIWVSGPVAAAGFFALAESRDTSPCFSTRDEFGPAPLLCLGGMILLLLLTRDRSFVFSLAPSFLSRFFEIRTSKKRDLSASIFWKP